MEFAFINASQVNLTLNLSYTVISLFVAVAALSSKDDQAQPFMFNRDQFWVRQAQAPLLDYQSAHWLETARFRTPDPE